MQFTTRKGHPEHPYPEHMERARQIAAEGMVLLRNDAGVLPMKPGRIALFGPGAVDTVYCGTGSGYAFAPEYISVEQGLREAGFVIVNESYLRRFEAASKKANEEDTTLSDLAKFYAGEKILIDEIPQAQEDYADYRREDAAIYVLRRNAGEGRDRENKKGDFRPSQLEWSNIERLMEIYDHLIVVLNTSVVSAQFLSRPGLETVLLMGYPGNEAGHALADVLTGKAQSGGRLTDTWAANYEDYPASLSFSSNDENTKQEDYAEDIYVGYRYFRSFGIKPVFPFGYGLSYTTFAQTVTEIRADWEEVRIQVQVTNTGKYPGRQVVQAYVSGPQGKLEKPERELKGFAKTRRLLPGEEETVEISFPTASMASFDTGAAAEVMERGTYRLLVGTDCDSASLCGAVKLPAPWKVRQLRNLVRPDHELDLFHALQAEQPELPADLPLITLDPASMPKTEDLTKAGEERGDKALVLPAADVTLKDVADGKVSLEAFTASLDDEVLLRLVTGTSSEKPYSVPTRMKTEVEPVGGPSSSGSTTSLFAKSLGIPNWKMTDGPAGLHILLHAATCWPSGTTLAQTWDPELAREVGRMMGEELAFYHQSVILGPGMNIHRDPLCGRNFEYYSEDPYLTGVMGAAVTRGVQSVPGCSVAVKHFACNNQENNRTSMNVTVSERALREIYLRGFEICVKSAHPHTVMTSYNCLNGVHTSSRRDLLEGILRGEWGFQGVVMTDWGSESDKADDLTAGNDLIMGGYATDLLKNEMDGKEPEFAEDGFVKVTELPVFGGFMTEKIRMWNSFLPCADGKDEITVQVPPGVQKNPEIKALQERDIAEVVSWADGSCSITYHGTRRGAYPTRASVEKCAQRVLVQIMNSLSWKLMYGEEK